MSHAEATTEAAPRSADILIVGAGPAGLTLAAEFVGLPLKVVVLESGRRHLDPAAQGANWIEPSGFPLAPDATIRARAVGGASAIWNTFVDRKQAWARLVPLDAFDFDATDLRPDGAWPIGFEEFSTYLPRAYRACGVEPPGPAAVAESRAGLAASIPGYEPTVETFVPARRFTEALPADLAASANVTVISAATVTGLCFGSDASVTGVTFRDGDGVDRELSAGRVVLAGGGIENARILLASGQTMPSPLGRYFCDHVQVESDTFRFKHGDAQALAPFDIRKSGSAFRMTKLQPTEALRREAGGINAAFSLRPTWRRASPLWRRGAFVAAAAGLAFHQRAVRPRLGSGLWSKVPFASAAFDGFATSLQLEQPARRENRMVLGSTIDEHGLPRVRVVTSFTEEDLRAVRVTRSQFAEAVTASGVAELVRQAPDPGSLDLRLGMSHHIATTRMAASDALGVVDSNCQVFGWRGLFCAGSSVFTSGGYANPTLAIIAMSLRLADHLKRDLGGHVEAHPVAMAAAR